MKENRDPSRLRVFILEVGGESACSGREGPAQLLQPPSACPAPISYPVTQQPSLLSADNPLGHHPFGHLALTLGSMSHLLYEPVSPRRTGPVCHSSVPCTTTIPHNMQRNSQGGLGSNSRGWGDLWPPVGPPAVTFPTRPLEALLDLTSPDQPPDAAVWLRGC